METVIGGILGVVLIMCLMMLYFLPSIIGHKTKYANGISILNLFLGWTLIGWVAALVWAVSAPKE